ncbi:MAG: alginate export family protein [Cytophagaceae bacterium]|nr:alginate export family protein [Cytophagaceae bacterium]MDW8456051.1 alginate export family protein [Cytophagaceae bacterium]
MKKNDIIKKMSVFLIVASFSNYTYSQLTINAQLRTRSEYRDGQGTLMKFGDGAGFFTNQRTRLTVGYTTDRLKLHTSVQDIRVWGQDVSTIGNYEGGRFFLHEGWGEITFSDSSWAKFADYLSLKIGRQEIVYDDSRLLGNLDWLQQARRHDAAILKWSKKNWSVDLGFALNNNSDAIKISSSYSDTVSTTYPLRSIPTGYPVPGTNGIGKMYKSMQYLYIAKKFAFGKVSYLFFKDDFSKPKLESSWSRMTQGFYLTLLAMRKLNIDAYAYYQGNEFKDGNTLDAYSFGANTMYQMTRKFSAGPGLDYMSGNNTVETQYASGATTNRAFDPLYGTPHKFWGYMDYFYVADGYGLARTLNQGAPNYTSGRSSSSVLSPGLINAFIKTQYKIKDNLMLRTDIHEYWAANKVANVKTTGPTAADSTDELNRRLGTEINILLNWNLTKAINFEAGYCFMAATPTMSALKAPQNIDKRLYANWAYLMITLRPDLFGEFNLFRKDYTKKVDEMSKKLDEYMKRTETLESK